MSELYLVRTLTGLAADNDESAFELRKIPIGTTVKCEISRPRSLQQLRYYWALCNLVASNHATLQTKDQVDQTLRLLTGHCDAVKVRDNIVYIPRRLAFSKCEQEEFNAFLKRAKDAVMLELLPGVQMAEIEDEIARMAS